MDDVGSALEFFERAYARHARYWHHANRDSTDPAHFPEPWKTLLRLLRLRRPGRALDLGAGEGSDAIRLARLGYEVDAVEGTAVGADKIGRFARQAGVRVNAIHADARRYVPRGHYDVIISSGMLHYLAPADQRTVLSRLAKASAPGGLIQVLMFTEHTPVAECHRIVDVYPDRDGSFLKRSLPGRRLVESTEIDKPDHSHHDFPAHSHSFVKVLVCNDLGETAPPPGGDAAGGDRG